MGRIRKILLSIFLLTLFTAYQVGITMFTHVHYVNGVMVVHSHPFQDKHHTHTKAALIVISLLNCYHSSEIKPPYHFSVERPLLWTVRSEIVVSDFMPLHLKTLCLRAPPFIGK